MFNNVTDNAKIQNSSHPDVLFKDDIHEKLHIKFCKSILGVNRKSTNFAVLSELGRFPFYYNISMLDIQQSEYFFLGSSPRDSPFTSPGS